MRLFLVAYTISGEYIWQSNIILFFIINQFLLVCVMHG